jgi:hypothetical protein
VEASVHERWPGDGGPCVAGDTPVYGTLRCPAETVPARLAARRGERRRETWGEVPVPTLPVLLVEVLIRMGFRLVTGGLALLFALLVCLGAINLAAGAVDQLIAVRLQGTEGYVARQREALAAVTGRIAGAGQAGVAPSPDDVADARFHEAEIYDKEMALASAYATWLLAFMPIYVTVVLAVLVPLWRLDPVPLWSKTGAWLERRGRGGRVAGPPPAPDSRAAAGPAVLPAGSPRADPPPSVSPPQPPATGSVPLPVTLDRPE